MHDALADPQTSELGARLRADVVRVAARLADTLAPLADHQPELAGPLAFLRALTEPGAAPAGPGGDDPVDRLIDALALSPAEVDLLYLAALPEEHEGLASVLRAVHPRREPRATVGLAAQLFCTGHRERILLRSLLEQGPAFVSGLIRTSGDVPFFERTIHLAEALWSVLHGIDVWPDVLDAARGPVATSGMGGWLAAGPPARAAAALAEGAPVTVLVTARTSSIALDRAAAIARHARVGGVRLTPRRPVDAEVLQLAGVHTLARGLVPLLAIPPAERGPTDVPEFDRLAGPVVLAAVAGSVRVAGTRPLLTVPVTPLPAVSRRRMWSELLPELANHAPELASRHPIEPAEAALTAVDVRKIEGLEGRAMTMSDVSASVRARAGLTLSSGVNLLHPQATWDQLVLSDDKLRQLRQALGRLRHQSLVLDEWGFLAGRRGARGVRMMFSGPPGTGKTLSAEVMAAELGVDLLTVDISRVVSKWIGETEKNLAEVFDAAERSQAVLFFDEADALFSKRTEVSDAHDRYANLETAYLLARLEGFEGLAVLASNLKSNIDPAFLRRLEFVIDFRPPSAEEREDLWRCHLPPGAPLSPNVDLRALAARFTVVGALIRNAATAAAFAAAEDDEPIGQHHLVEAMRTEYEKAGLAYPAGPMREAV